MKQKNNFALIPMMFCFFAMGFVDLVGIASNYVKEELSLSDSKANIFPSLVFFWFLIFSVPTGMLMNKIGRKRTVLLSLLLTAVSLALPLIGSSFPIMLVAFSLLGIGNALMQTSLNPLVSAVVGGDNLASTLTFGQFVKAIASFMAPYLAMWGATSAIPTLGLSWRVLFLIYFTVSVIATIALAMTPIDESPSPSLPQGERSASAPKRSLFSLPLGEGWGGASHIILLSFLGIMCHVGLDVGINTTAPKLLMERLGMTLNEAAFATSLYFIFRTIGCFSGSLILRVMDNRTFFAISVGMMAIAMVGMGVGTSKLVLYTAIALAGYGNSNIFSLVYTRAILAVPDKQNEVSGLMIMGLFGGTIFPLVMGFASDFMGQVGAVLVMSLGVVYLAFHSRNI